MHIEPLVDRLYAENDYFFTSIKSLGYEYLVQTSKWSSEKNNGCEQNSW